MTMIDAGEAPPFVVTRQHRRFAEFCDTCMAHRYIGLCYGPPGVGKTLSARRFAKWDVIENTAQAACTREEGRPVPDALLECRSVFYTAPVVNSPVRVEKAVADASRLLTGLLHQARDRYNLSSRADDQARSFTRLIVVDEVERLNVPSLEQLREIYDRGGVGMVLIGMPGIEKKLSRYPQLFSRVGFVHRFGALNAEELRTIITQSWEQLGMDTESADFDDDAMALIIRITGGNFRVLHRLLSQVTRVLEINKLERATSEVVEVAAESLVIGTSL